MNKAKGPFAISNKIKLLLNTKEIDLVERSSLKNIKLHSVRRLKQYIKLAREFRKKYWDLNQRQKVARPGIRNMRTIQKSKVFERILSSYEKQLKKIESAPIQKKSQAQLDHEEHYDIDGVTQVKGKVVIPSRQPTQNRNRET